MLVSAPIVFQGPLVIVCVHQSLLIDVRCVNYVTRDSGLADTVSGKLQNNNIYTIAKRNVEGQDMLYQSLKLTNGIWILAELRIQPGNPNYTVEYLTVSNQLLR